MGDEVKMIREFICRKLMTARRVMKRRFQRLDPYREGYIDALSMVQSYIDKVIVNGREQRVRIPDEAGRTDPTY